MSLYLLFIVLKIGFWMLIAIVNNIVISWQSHKTDFLPEILLVNREVEVVYAKD